MATSAMVFTDPDGNPPAEDKVRLCLEWLEDYGKTRKTVNRNHITYGWKHVVEWDYGPTHVPHWAFLEAARRFGLKMVPVGDGRNYYVNLSEKCDTDRSVRRGRKRRFALAPEANHEEGGIDG